MANTHHIPAAWRDRIYLSAAGVRERRPGWYEAARVDPAFVASGGTIYGYDIIDANMDPMVELFDATGVTAAFERGEIDTVCDIGCANGDLSFTYALAGHRVTALDWSYKHDQAPALVSSIARAESLPVSVVDTTIDRHFSLDDLRGALVHDAGTLPDERFDLVICFGLLYHLKNPFAFLESLSAIAGRVILGTHLMTHAPRLGSRLDGDPLAYLVEADELNSDPTNYWVLTEKAFHRLVRRSGFRIVGSSTIANNPLGIALPDRVDYGVRGFVVLEPC